MTKTVHAGVMRFVYALLTGGGGAQGRIYVANEYPTVVRTILIVCQKQRILRQFTLNSRQNLSVLIKNTQILG